MREDSREQSHCQIYFVLMLTCWIVNSCEPQTSTLISLLLPSCKDLILIAGLVRLARSQNDEVIKDTATVCLPLIMHQCTSNVLQEQNNRFEK